MIDILDVREIESVEINTNNLLKYNTKIIDEPLYFDLDDEKEFRKYLKYIKNLIRSSIEYKDYVNYVKNFVFNNHSGFDPNIQDENKVRTELHHVPFTLEDIILVVYKKNLDMKRSLDPIDIAEEVMELHFNNIVGVYNLNQTQHELIHNNALFIPINIIFGNVNEFYEMYKKYLDDYQLELYDNYLKLSKEVMDKGEIYNKEYFDINIVKFDKDNSDKDELLSITNSIIKSNYNH